VWQIPGAVISWLEVFRSAWRRSSPIPTEPSSNFLKECQSQGYVVVLIFIGLDSADLSRGRVMERVEAGGHDVPDDKIVTRFPRTFTNLRQALSFVNQALLFDNSSADEPYRFVAEFRDGKRKRGKGYHPAWAAFQD
jgi:predicted ABC-type ATPase